MALPAVIERWELLQAQSRSDLRAGPQELTSDLDDITSWLENVMPELESLQQSDPSASIEDLAAKAKELKVTDKKKIQQIRWEVFSVCVCNNGSSFAGDAEDVYSLQVHHAVCEPASSGSSRKTGQPGGYEPRLEPSVYRPPAVGHQSEEDADALPGEKKCQVFMRDY